MLLIQKDFPMMKKKTKTSFDHKLSKHRSEKAWGDTRHKGKLKNTLNRAIRKHFKQLCKEMTG